MCNAGQVRDRGTLVGVEHPNHAINIQCGDFCSIG